VKSVTSIYPFSRREADSPKRWRLCVFQPDLLPPLRED